MGDRIVAQTHEEMAKGQAERLIPLLEETLMNGGVAWSDLTRLGVGVGPGNFTGIRISVATARGLALALGIPAVGVSELAAAAFGHVEPVVVLQDARRGNIYIQGFHGAEPSAPQLTSLQDVMENMRPSGRLVSHGPLPDLAGSNVAAPIHPVATAIAHIAAAYPPPFSPPKPLYLRPADAAPAATRPPEIVP